MTWKCDGLLYLLSTTSSTASSCDTEFTKEDEQRLKDYIQQLKNDRAAVKLTMLELESVHIDPLSYDVKPRGDSQRLDLENAVLMQELMAMKVSMGGPGGGFCSQTQFPVSPPSSQGNTQRSLHAGQLMRNHPHPCSVASPWRRARASFVDKDSSTWAGRVSGGVS